MFCFSLNMNLCLPYKFAIYSVRCYQRTCNIGKRGKMLNSLIRNNDKRKNWHMSLMSKPEKNRNIFEKIHKPSRRVSVLNALFVRNITDILSTSDIAPEVVGFGIEITQIKITNDYQLVNVFWEVPLSKLDLSVDIQKILSMRAPKIRAEMISRNILGRVPKIFFVRDETNSRAAEFEKALLNADLGPEGQEKIIPDDEFMENVFAFTSAKEKRNQERDEKKKMEEVFKLDVPKNKDASLPLPQNHLSASLPLPQNHPSDMKSNLLGLNHETLIAKVFAAKKKCKADLNNESTKIEESEKNDLFNQIPGITLQPNTNREKILKQFCMNRKLLMKERKRLTRLSEADIDIYSHEASSYFDFNDSELESDYFEEENIHEDF